MLARAVEQRRAREKEPADTVVEKPELAPLPDLATIELPIDSFIPQEYIQEPQFRFRLYRRMAGLTTLESVDEMAAELVDRFGSLPDEVDNLLFQIRVKALASRAGVQSISPIDTQISIRVPGLESADRRALQRQLGDQVRVSRQAVWLPWEKSWDSPWRVALVQTLERLADSRIQERL